MARPSRCGHLKHNASADLTDRTRSGPLSFFSASNCLRNHVQAAYHNLHDTECPCNAPQGPYSCRLVKCLQDSLLTQTWPLDLVYLFVPEARDDVLGAVHCFGVSQNGPYLTVEIFDFLCSGFRARECHVHATWRILVMF